MASNLGSWGSKGGFLGTGVTWTSSGPTSTSTSAASGAASSSTGGYSYSPTGGKGSGSYGTSGSGSGSRGSTGTLTDADLQREVVIGTAEPTPTTGYSKAVTPTNVSQKQ